MPVPGSPLRTSAPLVPDELIRRVRMLLDDADHNWSWHVEAPWVYVNPAGVELPEQGWKLHVTATERTAVAVLSAVVPLLLAEGVPFKFAGTREIVRVLNSSSAARASGGKFITIYPLDDAQAVRVADACHRATAHLHGPAILSDRPYRPGSLVHYRYGGFRDQHAIDADGMVVHLIRNADGDLVPDERRALYQAPPGLSDPFQPAVAAPSGSAEPAPAPTGPVKLHDRYVVRAALRHANKGGTYLAEDTRTGLHVVIKEGRPHVGADSGGDARDRVRHEAAMLERVATVGRAPRLVDVFEQQGHVFLVEDHVPADSLRDVVADAYDPPAPGLPAADVARMAASLAETMAAFHAAGVVLRDFNPNNILVAGDDLVVIDLELALPAGETAGAAAAGTPGYASPEQLSGRPTGPPDDYWSLGATIAYVATGADPYLPADVGHTWTDPDRLEAWLARHVAAGRVDAGVAGVILGCMATRPGERLSAAGALTALAALADGWRPTRAATPRARRRPAPPPVPAERAAADAVGWLLSTLGRGTGGHLWPAGPTGIPLDPCNVQSGASGVGIFLCRAAEELDVPRLGDAIGAAAGWVSERVARGPERPPGLYFGLSGVVWFLTEAARTLGRPDLLRRANELALALPVRAANPDVSHGTAGIGLGQLHQWLRTGDDRFLARAVLAAEHLHNGAGRDAAGVVVWPVPTSAPSRLAGTTSYGFAHGTAGIAAFLLYAGAATGESAFTGAALTALDSLMSVAVPGEDGGDTAFWPKGPGDDELWPHWCSGSSGVGTALVRAFAATGEARYRQVAQSAARAGLRERWRGSSVQCHGFAGDAELLLDLAGLGRDAGAGDLAAEAAADLWLGRRHDLGFAVFADDTGGGVSAGFGTGLAGVGSFFLRLATGGPRPFLLDELLPATDRPGPILDRKDAAR